MRAIVGSIALIFLMAGISPGQSADTSGTVPLMKKKIVEYGWDVPTPDYIRAHIRDMEQRPFDGLLFRCQGGTNVLEPKVWTESAFASDYENLANTAWEKFTDNFVMMLAASEQDWFDDAQWSAILSNTRLVAKAGALGKCIGVCFDPEPYGKNPWTFTEVAHKDLSFAEYEAICRRRGAEFIQAIEAEFPHPRILSFYQISLFKEYCVPMTPQERATKLAQHPYALYPAFFQGMLEAASPGVYFIDGNENAYYYTESSQYFSAYHLAKQQALYLIDPALWNKYRAQVQSGQALYVDQYFGLRADRVLGNYMTASEQAMWFEHNVYWALASTDEYVWCYSEPLNWWTNQGVPKDAESAIRSGRTKHDSGAPLKFDLAPIVRSSSKREHGVTD